MMHNWKQWTLLLGLWGAVMSSALAVVMVTHKARNATHQLEELRHEAADLHVESGQLLLEKSSLSAFARVERTAFDKLNMVVPELEQVVIVKP